MYRDRYKHGAKVQYNLNIIISARVGPNISFKFDLNITYFVSSERKNKEH